MYRSDGSLVAPTGGDWNYDIYFYFYSSKNTPDCSPCVAQKSWLSLENGQICYLFDILIHINVFLVCVGLRPFKAIPAPGTWVKDMDTC